jgi:hypothetical protein
MTGFLLRLATLLGIGKLAQGTPAARKVAAALIFVAGFFLLTIFIGTFTSAYRQSLWIAVLYLFGMCVLGFWAFRLFSGNNLTSTPANPNTPKIRRAVQQQAQEIEQKLNDSAKNSPKKSSVVTGLVGVGKRSLASALSGRIDVEVIGSTSVDSLANRAIASRASGRVLIYVVANDLYSYEHRFLSALGETGIQWVVALNKSDLLTSTARNELLASIDAKCQRLTGYRGAVCCAAGPRPKLVVRVLANGDEVEEEVASAPELGSLIEKITRDG